MSFLNSELILSVFQCAEMQAKAYQKFLELLDGDNEGARVQTQIYMRALLQPSRNGRGAD